MPAYPWLEEAQVDLDVLEVKLKAMQSLGVPYSNDQVKRGREAYLEQANAIVEGLQRDGVQVAPESELIALIAYMQRLGVDIKSADPDELSDN